VQLEWDKQRSLPVYHSLSSIRRTS